MGLRPGTPGASGGKNYKVGLKQLMTNLNLEIGAIQGRGVLGLIKATREIKAETLKGGLATPKETGNLRESYFSVSATGVSDGRNPKFRDNPDKPKLTASSLIANHSAVIAESQAMAKAMSTRGNSVVVFGYSAPYAGYVHEFINPDIAWTTAGTGAKWFEAAIKTKKDTILKIIGDNARLRK